MIDGKFGKGGGGPRDAPDVDPAAAAGGGRDG